MKPSLLVDTRALLLACVPCVALCASSPSRGPTEEPLRIPLGLIEPDIPLDRPVIPERVALGRKLFNDTRLSVTGAMSCATCHQPERAFSESRATSRSALEEDRRRNAQTLLNVGFLPTLDWDGRFRSLEDQVDGVFSPYGDMGQDIGQAIAQIEHDDEYIVMFDRAFGREINARDLKIALATFQRTLLSGDSPFDRFLFAQDNTALTEEQKQGWGLFIGKASCISCHDVFHPSVNSLGGGIAIFTDHRFHNLGVGYENGRMTDVGRYEVTQERADWGAFKTPMLRNIALTSPYMHDGSLNTLEEVVDFYDRGGNPNPNLSPGIKPLFLDDEERKALVAFLQSLTEPAQEMQTASPDPQRARQPVDSNSGQH